MKRIAWIVTIIAVVLLLMIGGLIAWVQLRDEVSNGNLIRSAEPRVFWGRGETNVTLRYQPTAGVTCPPIRRAANVLLLVDKSDSMSENDAFASAVNAAQAYIDTLDFTVSRAGVVFFDDWPQLAAAPTQDAATLRAALTGFTPLGTTDIAAALAFAETTLADLPAQNSGAALPALIVLLTDGQANDPAAALSVGRRLQVNDVRLITVGVGQADNAFLLDLASSPSDHFEVADAQQLPALYTELASQLNSAIAFNMNLVEPVNSALQIVSPSVTPAAVIEANQITWQVASIGPEGATFNYRAAVNGLGLRSLNSGESVMAYTDCVAGAVSAALPDGPQLLVLPPGWLAFLLLLLPLLPLLFLSFFRRPKLAPERQTVAPAPSLSEPEPVDPTPAWLKRLTDIRTLSEGVLIEGAAEKWTPTLIMGVGPVGRIVLPQIAQALRGRFGESWPPEVRLLQIDIQPKGSNVQPLQRPDYLSPEQWVVLEPDLDQVQRNLDRNRERFSHLDWYPATAPGYERSRARMALFYDLKDGAGQSRLWQGLSAATLGLTNPKLRLVGSTFDDASSGILVDLARLVQILSRTDVDVELWLSLPVGQDWSPRLHAPRQKVRANEQATRTLATLRELERFQRNTVVPFHYVADGHLQTQLHGDARMAVIQTLFLFEPPDGTNDVNDHLTTLTDALLAMLPTEAQQAVSQHLSRMSQRAGQLINHEGLGMACSLGAFAVRLPLETLTEALGWRVLHDLLYDTRVGLLPVARLDDAGQYENVELYEFQAATDSSTLREAAQQFVSRFGGRVDSPMFNAHLAHEVSNILNGENQGGGQPVLQRVGGLVHAQNWLQAVRNVLLREGQTGAANVSKALEDQLYTWQQFLLEELRPVVVVQLSQAQAALAALAGQTHRQWVIPAGLDWDAYCEQIRPWKTGSPRANVAGEPLLRVGQRFGWHVSRNEQSGSWSLDLLVPKGAFVWSEDGVDLSAMAVRRQPEDVIAPLHHLAHAVARSRAEVRADWVLDVAETLDPTAWLRRAETRLDFNGQEASERLGGGLSEAAILVAPQSARATELQKKLTITPDRFTVTLAGTKDATAATLLRIRDRVPIYTLTNWGEEAWERQAVLPSLYVWRGEQRAAECETDINRLSPIFVSWLERDPQLLDRFARAYLYGLYELHLERAYLPGIGQWPATNVGEALENLLSRDDALQPPTLLRDYERQPALRALDEAIEKQHQALWQSPGRSSFLRQVEAERLAPLRHSGDQRESDLARYLQTIVKQL